MRGYAMTDTQQREEATCSKTAIEAEVEAMAEGKLKYTVNLAAQTSTRLNAVNAWLNQLV